jgi:hypothetical protein
MPVQPRTAVTVDSEGDPGTPPQQSAGQRLDAMELGRQVDAGKPRELLANDGGLEFALGRGRRVLPVASASQTGPRVWARRLHSIRRAHQQLDRIRAAVGTAPVLGDPGEHSLARQRVPDEHDAPVVAADAGTAVRRRSDIDLDERALQRADVRHGWRVPVSRRAHRLAMPSR